jgi:TPR repeat protein
MKALQSIALLLAFGTGVWGITPEQIAEWKEAAEKGDPAAQLNLGFAYANGDSVPEDYAMAYAWWNIASANGEATAKLSKKDLAERMTKEQIAEAQKLSREMGEANPKLLDSNYVIETETEEGPSLGEIWEQIKKKLLPLLPAS